MLIIVKLITLTLFLGVISLLSPGKALANVGTVDIRSTTSEEYRCWASSLIMSDKSYQVTINCANLIYPPTTSEISFYLIWATPTTGKTPIKLGDLGKGEARFQVKQPFSALYVTIEPNTNVRAPGTNVIMRGNIEPISFLKKPTSPTPTLEPEDKEDDAPKTTTNTSNLSTRDKLMLALRRAGIAALIALIAIVGLIFVVTRSRG